MAIGKDEVKQKQKGTWKEALHPEALDAKMCTEQVYEQCKVQGRPSGLPEALEKAALISDTAHPQRQVSRCVIQETQGCLLRLFQPCAGK